MALQTVTSLAIILFLFVLPTIAADFSGEVVGVLDGDTLEVLHNNHFERGGRDGQSNCQVAALSQWFLLDRAVSWNPVNTRGNATRRHREKQQAMHSIPFRV